MRSLGFLPLAALYLGPVWGTPLGAEEAWITCRRALYDYIGLGGPTSSRDTVPDLASSGTGTGSGAGTGTGTGRIRDGDRGVNSSSKSISAVAEVEQSIPLTDVERAVAAARAGRSSNRLHANAPAPAMAPRRTLTGSESVAAYKAGMFVASRQAILAQPLAMWRGLLQALRGEARGANGLPLPCGRDRDRDTAALAAAATVATATNNSTTATTTAAAAAAVDPGPMLGGQVERLWHIFFGRETVLRSRSRDMSLPRALREPDCAGFGRCGGAV